MIHVRFTYLDPIATGANGADAALRAQAREQLLPQKQTLGSAGFDLVAAVDVELAPGARALVGTGIALALPTGHEAQIRPRSGLALKHGVTCLNAPGTIDSDYRGEIKVLLINHGDVAHAIQRGDRIAQLVIGVVTPARFVAVDGLEDTLRGGGGFGSTGA